MSDPGPSQHRYCMAAVGAARSLARPRFAGRRHVMADMNLPGVEIRGAMQPGFDEILTPEAVGFIVDLERRFGAERQRLLARRAEVQAKLDAGEKPDFLKETAKIRDANWTVAPLPKDLLDRRVEITGPVDRKMIINALNSGA